MSSAARAGSDDIERRIGGLRAKPWGWLVPAVVLGSLVPFAAIAQRAAAGRLGADPIATALNQLGLLALLFLMASLACTPVKVLFGLTWPMRVRRTLGLFAFGAALTHFAVYVVLDQMLMLRAIVVDVAKRPFIAVGFSALVLLVPLAWTSSKEAVRKLGFKRWKLLHRLVYVVGALAVIHFVLRVKVGMEPLVYASVLAALLAIRAFDWVRARKRRRA